MHGYRYMLPDGRDGLESLDEPCYAHFQHCNPVAMAGYSIYIYHITLDEANRVRRELGLPELPRSSGAERERRQ